MRVNLPGQPEHRPTSLTSPVCQVLLAGALFLAAVLSHRHAPTVRATDIWIYHALSVVLTLAGLLFLPFGIAAAVEVLRNRRN